MAVDETQVSATLRELRFFSGLTDEALRGLAAIAQYRRFTAGATLFAEGSLARELFVIHTGRVELCMTVPTRGCLPILTLEEGDLVGWSGVTGNSVMTATAIATIDTAALAISAAGLLAMCERDHEFGYQIMRRVLTAVSRRLVATRLQVLDLFADAPGLSGKLLEGTP